MRVELVHRLEHLPRLLGAGGRVEVRERLAIEDFLEVGEVGADLLRVEPRLRRDGHRSLYGTDGARASRLRGGRHSGACFGVLVVAASRPDGSREAARPRGATPRSPRASPGARSTNPRP